MFVLNGTSDLPEAVEEVSGDFFAHSLNYQALLRALRVIKKKKKKARTKALPP